MLQDVKTKHFDFFIDEHETDEKMGIENVCFVFIL